MNNIRRKRIGECIGTLYLVKDEIDDILCEEEDSYENMPENFQESERGSASSDAIDSLMEVVDGLNNAIEALEYIG